MLGIVIDQALSNGISKNLANAAAPVDTPNVGTAPIGQLISKDHPSFLKMVAAQPHAHPDDPQLNSVASSAAQVGM